MIRRAEQCGAGQIIFVLPACSFSSAYSYIPCVFYPLYQSQNFYPSSLTHCHWSISASVYKVETRDCFFIYPLHLSPTLHLITPSFRTSAKPSSSLIPHSFLAFSQLLSNFVIWQAHPKFLRQIRILGRRHRRCDTFGGCFAAFNDKPLPRVRHG